MKLDELGTRICILGPSNSGKSTLAKTLAESRDLTAVHLDQLYHLPNTDWEPRPSDEFIALHDEAILPERWVMDGNYSRCMPQRLARATGLILLDIPTAISLIRYFRRTLFENHARLGALSGGRDSVKWDMIYHIAITTRANRKRYAELFEQTHLPKIRLSSRGAIDGFYLDHRLQRPSD